jgi:formylmethanofuran dehydrogenase subunit E
MVKQEKVFRVVYPDRKEPKKIILCESCGLVEYDVKQKSNGALLCTVCYKWVKELLR